MLRDSLNSNNCKHFSLIVTGSEGVSNQWRSNTRGTTSNVILPGLSNINMWLKIAKTGNVFQAYHKTNSDTFSSWNTLASSQTINFGSSDDIFYYGIAVTSHSTTRLATLTGFIGSRLINQKFPLVDPKTNMALSARDSAHADGVHANGHRKRLLSKKTSNFAPTKGFARVSIRKVYFSGRLVIIT
eukprot:scaffold42520_cov70-Cyclotella_meneghiniana.AAC.2